MSVARPLLVTDDPDLLDRLLRVAAAAGVEPDVVRSAAAARRAWAAAPLVVVGDDLAEALSRGLPAPGLDVVLVGTDLDDAGVWRRAVALGARHVVFLPDAEDWLAGRLADCAEGPADRGRCLAVLGGRGGAGATTLATALAVTGVRLGLASFLLDADPLGGGIDLMFGVDPSGPAAGLRWPALADARGRISATALARELPRYEGLTVLSWEPDAAVRIPTAAMSAVLAAARRAADLVVLDLPRSMDAAAEHALAAASTVLLVVPAEARAVAAAARVATAAAWHCTDLKLVVRTGRGEPEVAPEDVADRVGWPVAGLLRTEARVPTPPGRRGRGPLADLCTRLLLPAA